MKRRDFFRLMLAAGALTGCSAASSSIPSIATVAATGAAQSSSGGAPAAAGENAAQPSGAQSKMLVAYFSQAGEQYNVGVIEEGNTSIVAHIIAGQTGADLFEIEAAVPYPDTLSELLDISEQEKTDNARPEITSTVDIADYDVVFIGYPIWWGDMPMIVYNFLESNDFSGKTIVPFCTHGGSGLARTERTIANITGAKLLDGLAIAGTTVQNEHEQARKAVGAWLEESGLASAE